jgi:hypothetical protein
MIRIVVATVAIASIAISFVLLGVYTVAVAYYALTDTEQRGWSRVPRPIRIMGIGSGIVFMVGFLTMAIIIYIAKS